MVDAFIVTEIHISEVKHGDTIIHTDGNMTTVDKNFIKKGGFHGTTLYGDSYRSGLIPVKKVTFYAQLAREQLCEVSAIRKLLNK